MYYVKIYISLLTQDIKTRMQYRSDFLISILGILASNICGVVSFWVLFSNIDSLNGWNYYELLFMYAFSLLAATPLQLFFDNLWQLDGYLIDGSFIKFYFKPINIFFYYIAEMFDWKAIAQLLFSLVALCFAWHKLNLPVTFASIAFCFVQWLGASLVIAGMMILASSAAFWINKSASIMTLIFKLKEYASYPVTIYTGIWRFALTFIIPLTFIAYYPSHNLLRPEQVSILAYFSPIVGIVVFCIGYKVWMKGTKVYGGTGT